MTLDSVVAQLIKSVSHEYNFAPGRVERLSGGFSNTSYFIETSNEQYVLTVFNEATYDEVVVLARLLQWLADKGFSTTRVQIRGEFGIRKLRPTRNGKRINILHYSA